MLRLPATNDSCESKTSRTPASARRSGFPFRAFRRAVHAGAASLTAMWLLRQIDPPLVAFFLVALAGSAPPQHGPRKTLYNRFVRWAAKGVWVEIFHALAAAGGPPAQVLIDSSAVKAHRCASGGKGGERRQAIGRSRGGGTTKIHALTDALCRPLAFMLTGGNVADCAAAALLLQQMPAASILHADKGCDSNAIRRQVEERGAMPNISPKANRKWKNCFPPFLYRNRNAIERMFGRLKDFSRIATRYDRLSVNYLAAVCLTASGSPSSSPAPRTSGRRRSCPWQRMRAVVGDELSREGHRAASKKRGWRAKVNI